MYNIVVQGLNIVTCFEKMTIIMIHHGKVKVLLTKIPWMQGSKIEARVSR